MRTCEWGDCGRRHYGHGLCNGHRLQKRRGQELRPLKHRSLSHGARFWANVDKTDTCWLWTGALIAGTGYAKFYMGGKHVAGHHAALIFDGRGSELDAVGVGRMVVDHVCDHRQCVNPGHLRVVTQRVNVLRGTSPSAINARKTHCKHGHPFDEANTHVTKAGNRSCRTCHRLGESARRRKL